MELQRLKDQFSIEDNQLFKNHDIRRIAETFLPSDQPSDYKLFHQYVFRSDIWEKHIKENYGYRLNSSEFSWNNPEIQDIIEDNSHFFVGYVKAKYKRKYSELFLSIKKYSPYRSNPNHVYKVTGYCVNIHDKDFYYMYENTIELGYRHFEHPIIVDTEINKAMQTWIKRINRSLQK